MFRKLEMLQVTKKKRLFVEHRALLPNIAQMKHGKKHKNQFKKENYCFVFRKLENNVASNKKKLITC